jgi:muramoyltetrapeptide carboxypeptidase LdcA involved in peptidoglycan recycling
MHNPQTLRFPKPLAAGDLIAVTAPSSGVPPALHPRLDLAIAALEHRGFRVLEGECLRQQANGASAIPRRRADELTAFLTAPEIAAVMPPWGGNLAIELLDLVDFDALASSPAKWFSGFSDLSTLHLPLTTIAGWATVHGPNLMQFGASAVDETTAGLWALLTASHGVDFEQRSSIAFERVSADWKSNPGANLVASEKTKWKRFDGAEAPLHLEGRLIGGCLDTLSRLAGTRYGNVPAYIASSGKEGTLLYLENAELAPFEVARALHCLRMHGWLDGLHGILLGRNAATGSSDDFTYMDALRSALDGVCCPTLYDLDIGHLPPQVSLVNGAFAKIDYAAGSGSIVQQFR